MEMPPAWMRLKTGLFYGQRPEPSNENDEGADLLKEMAEALEYYSQDQRYYEPMNINSDAARITLKKFNQWK